MINIHSFYAAKIPQSLFTLPTLEEIYLDSYDLSGPIGDVVAPLTSPLQTVGLGMNQLTGPIPQSFFQLKHLENLDLQSNRLSGTIELGLFWN